ncbi:LPXTG cell wall anchor domain-containing protein [Streptococcus pluranimalium]|uniref:LPXTG cell wall anchor domain-containing protein n=1 Tax=Streptococcus pluranimalium TaxID=82348 RepID=UPI003F68D164
MVHTLGNQKAALKAENHYGSKKSSLPETGEATSASFILVGLSILGIAGLTVKRKNS